MFSQSQCGPILLDPDRDRSESFCNTDDVLQHSAFYFSREKQRVHSWFVSSIPSCISSPLRPDTHTHTHTHTPPLPIPTAGTKLKVRDSWQRLLFLVSPLKWVSDHYYKANCPNLPLPPHIHSHLLLSCPPSLLLSLRLSLLLPLFSFLFSPSYF